MARHDERMIRFLQVFAKTLNVEEAELESGIEVTEAEARFSRSRELRRKLDGMFARRNMLYDAVPLSTIRAVMIEIMADSSNGSRDRVAAGRLLIELVTGPETGAETVGQLLKAIAGAADSE